jgi:hypothetical protein
MTSAETIVRRILSTSTDAAPIPVGQDRWREVLADWERNRCLGVAGAAVAQHQLILSDDQEAELNARIEAWARLALSVERATLAAVSALEEAGIQYRVLKGVAAAHTLYPSPSWRHFADADLLVRAEDITKAASVLGRSLGAERLLPPRRANWDATFGKDLPLRVGVVEIDLHRTIAPGAWGLRIPVDRLFDDLAVMRLGGTDLAMLTPAQQLLHALLTAALGDRPPRVSSLADAILCLRTKPFDPELVRRWRVGAPVAAALAWIGVANPLEPPGRKEQALLRLSGLRVPLARELLGASAVVGGRAKIRYLTGVAFPDRSYMAARRRARA